jgi:hypothetical protein
MSLEKKNKKRKMPTAEADKTENKETNIEPLKKKRKKNQKLKKRVCTLDLVGTYLIYDLVEIVASYLYMSKELRYLFSTLEMLVQNAKINIRHDVFPHLIRAFKDDRPKHKCLPYAVILKPKDIKLLTNPKMIHVNVDSSDLDFIWSRLVQHVHTKNIECLSIQNCFPSFENKNYSFGSWLSTSNIKNVHLIDREGATKHLSIDWIIMLCTKVNLKISNGEFHLEAPASLKQLKLSQLRFLFADLLKLKQTFSTLVSLSLQLRQCTNTSLKLQEFVLFQDLSNLVNFKIEFSCQQSWVIIEFWKDLQTWFSSSKCNLENLNICCHNISVEFRYKIKEFLSSIFKIPKLKTLELKMSLFQSDLEFLVKCAQEHPSLCFLDISNNIQTSIIDVELTTSTCKNPFFLSQDKKIKFQNTAREIRFQERLLRYQQELARLARIENDRWIADDFDNDHDDNFFEDEVLIEEEFL